MTRLWWREARAPLALFSLAAVVLSTLNLDIAFARLAFFDSVALHWRGAGTWWADALIHDAGRWLVRIIAAAAVFLWSATFVNGRLLEWRRPAGYLALALTLTVGVVGLLKVITNVDCPWDLAPFGGRFPYEHLFADRPDYLRHAHCFPAAHASAGYALMALYFVALECSRRLARIGLWIGVVTGLIFGFAQQSRGAHFLSHDLCSAMLAWLIPLTLYACGFRGRLWDAKHWLRMPQSVHSSGLQETHRELQINAPSRTASIGSHGLVARGGAGSE